MTKAEDTSGVDKPLTAYLVDLVSNHKIPVITPYCKAGRDDLNDVVITGDQSISRFHFVITKEGDHYYIEDNKSKHGTFLNGNPLTVKEQINDGDVLKAGVTLFWFALETADNFVTDEDIIAASKNPSSFKDSLITGPMEVGPRPSNRPITATETSLRLPAISLDKNDIKGKRPNDKVKNSQNQKAINGKNSGKSKDKNKPMTMSGKFRAIESELDKLTSQYSEEQTGSEEPPIAEIDLQSQEETGLMNKLSDSVSSKPFDEKETVAIKLPPAWCNNYLSTELGSLDQEVATLKEETEKAKQKFEETETRCILTKNLRDTLLSAEGIKLVEACAKVLSYLGFEATVSKDDQQEIELKSADKVCIVRIVWDSNMPERSHLGQLSMSQTKYWCEQGIEPKGILIISHTGDEPPKPVNTTEGSKELAEFASKKNVCLMTTIQLLSLYRDVVLNKSNPEPFKEEIISATGWLAGFSLDPAEPPKIAEKEPALTSDAKEEPKAESEENKAEEKTKEESDFPNHVAA